MKSAGANSAQPGSRSSSAAAPTDRLSGFDALRGVAALIVLLFHAGKNLDVPKFFSNGYLAVDFFFMLSGYVMARTYDDKLRNGLSGAVFFVRRYARLWPVMAIGGMMGFPLLLIKNPDMALMVASSNLMLFPVFFGRAPFPLNGPA